MRHWTAEARQKQAQLIRRWQPWKKSTGSKTPQGKARSRMNALRHGQYSSQTQSMRTCLNAAREVLRVVGALRKSRKNPRIFAQGKSLFYQLGKVFWQLQGITSTHPVAGRVRNPCGRVYSATGS